MNRKSILIWAMAIGTLSSCMSNEDMYDPEKIAAMKVAKYEAAFVQKYGKVDPKQDWGFGEAATKAVTRTHDSKSNMWSDYVEVPTASDLTEEKVNEIVTLFKEPTKATVIDKLNWSDFFVQFVYLNPLRKNVNQLAVYKGEVRDVVNNFNQSAGGIMLMVNSGTDDFSYLGEDGEHNDHIIVYYKGDYYVGFDFQYHGNGNVNLDGDYSDYILRIVPAKYKKARRIMVEDLSVDSKSDFDFNDVVFDAVRDGNEFVITLQAVGGMLPLYIGSNDAEYEVHKLFDVEQNVFVNTRNYGEKAPVIFRLGGYNSNSTVDDIAIYVEGQPIKQQKEVGKKAPAKLCCPTIYLWAPESHSIENNFPTFAKAVQNHDVEWYEGGNEEPK